MTSPVATPAIHDLRRFSARQLRPLLEFESELWHSALRWDYRASTDLLLQYIDSETLNGFVATQGGEIGGFAFAVFEAHKAVVGDVFSYTAFAHAGRPSLHMTELLFRSLLGLLRASPMLQRVETQLLLYNADTLGETYRQEGFSVYPRLFLERPLSSADAQRGRALTAEFLAQYHLVLRRWQPGDYQHAADLIHAAYGGHVDAEINDQYRSVEGSLRFLHHIVRFPGCGVFESQHSWVLQHAQGRRLIAIILCSRVDDKVAHVTQLCVDPDLRRQRLGEGLLQHCIRELARAGWEALTLTVTESNTGAVALYRELGFGQRHRFDAAVLEL